MVLNQQPLLDSFHSSKPLTFKDKFTFVDVRRLPAAWAMLEAIYQRPFPDLDEVVGNAMVDRETYQPVGVAIAWFEPTGIVSIQASFGGYFRQYPKDIMASMAPTVKAIIASGAEYLYAIADEDIEGSLELVRWMGGERTGDRSDEPPIGDVYQMDLNGPRIQAWVAKRGG